MEHYRIPAHRAATSGQPGTSSTRRSVDNDVISPGAACRIVWKTCAHCGEPLAARRRSQTVHFGCQYQANRHKARQRYREDVDQLGPVYDRMDRTTQMDMLDRLHQATYRDQELTMTRAHRSCCKWTKSEDRLLTTYPDRPARELALLLGRSLYAIRKRRCALGLTHAED